MWLSLLGAAAAAPSPTTPPITEPRRASAAPIEAAIVVGDPELLATMADRLSGHRFTLGDHVLVIDDVAGQGRPWVGVVVASCGQLWLRSSVTTLRLTGPLARMRIAGPGYLVWAVGVRGPSQQGTLARGTGGDLALLRLGVLARPDQLTASLVRSFTPPRPPRDAEPLNDDACR